MLNAIIAIAIHKVTPFLATIIKPLTKFSQRIIVSFVTGGQHEEEEGEDNVESDQEAPGWGWHRGVVVLVV